MSLNDKHLFELKAGNYTLSGGVSNIKIQLIKYDNGNVSIISTTESNETFTLENDAQVYIRVEVPNGKTINNVKVYPMVEIGSTASTYQSFIQKTINVDNNKFTDTINVGTEIDSANRVNVLYSHNLLNSGMVGGTFSNGVPSTNNPNKRLRNDDYIQVNSNDNYTISASYNGSLQVNIMQYDASKNFIIETGWNNVPKTQLILSNCKYIMFVFKDANDADISTSTITKIQVKKGSEVIAEFTNKSDAEIFIEAYSNCDKRVKLKLIENTNNLE